MRLWHSKLIPLLDNPRLSDLHMSCCNLRGLGWGKRNKNIDYIYEDPLGEEALVAYHMLVLTEMEHRGYNFEHKWYGFEYCGKRRQARQIDTQKLKEALLRNIPLKEHTLTLFMNDVETLRQRGLPIEITHQTGYDYDCAPYVVYTASNGNKTIQYGIRL